MGSGRNPLSSTTSFQAQVINFKRHLNTSFDENPTNSMKSYGCASLAKDYIEGLYQQGSKTTTLIYGKNNVQVLPKDCLQPMVGYLSLHKNLQTLAIHIKWTPNQLMSGSLETSTSSSLESSELSESSEKKQSSSSGKNKDFYWNYALNINLEDIVYVHCHQNKSEDSSGTVILVSHDGIQRPPIIFPGGGHMQQFLACLETSLLPQGQLLDPPLPPPPLPLWSTEKGIVDRIFPWTTKKKNSVRRHLTMTSSEEVSIDYVFRIVNKSRHEEFGKFLLSLFYYLYLYSEIG